MNNYFQIRRQFHIQNHFKIKMGHQYTRMALTIKQEHDESAKWTGSISPKTSFHYIHPIKCDAEEYPHCEDLKDEEIDIKTQQAQYWEIQNNQQQVQINSKKDLDNIQAIKVKWNQFIKMKKKNYLQDYSVLKEIGRGGFGCVHKVKAKYTGIYRAAKRIKKGQLKKAQHQKLFQEMAIMISLDHPNIAKLYQVYDYKSYYVLILQLCEGGQLFKKIVTKQLNEQASARVMKQILWTLIYIHKKGIVHRDLKPQNMLFQLQSDTLKIIDFGIAVKKKPNQILTARLGTPYYIAPEVLCKSYGQKCDVWSAGVILFMMISGYPPFRGDNEYQVMENVLKQPVVFKGTVWGKVSSECKNLISLMLKKNPQERPSAQEAFNHPWIKKVIESTKSFKQDNVLANIRDFSFQNKLQAVVYTYIVSQLLTSNEKKLLFQTFKDLDKNNDGVIESVELAEALRHRKEISEQRVKFLVRIIDTNGSGHIDYTEFLVAGLNPRLSLNESHFEQAFQYFDIDHSGAITFQQIAHFLQNTKQSQQSIKKIFQQVDENNDGNISKQEFVKLLMHETKKKINSLRTIKLCQEQDSGLKKDNKGNNNPSINTKVSQQTKSQQQKITNKVNIPDSSMHNHANSKKITQMVVHEKGQIDKRQKKVSQNQQRQSKQNRESITTSMLPPQYQARKRQASRQKSPSQKIKEKGHSNKSPDIKTHKPSKKQKSGEKRHKIKT